MGEKNKTVEFEFGLNDKVLTPLGANAVITMLGVDEGGQCYFVASGEIGHNDRWWHEGQLTKT